jgi:lysophospholipid acyltransferase (LPLAT)-like uncharacterized protein
MGKSLRKKILRTLMWYCVPVLGAMILRFLYFTNKKHFFLPDAIPKESVIFAFWHCDLLMQPYVYRRFRKIPKAKVMSSEHFDGLVMAKTMRLFGLDTIHGSTTRGGAKVLIQGLKALGEGYDIGITPDGPKGPRYSIGNGIVIMAQKRHAKVVVFNCIPSSFWQLSTWDRFVIPKPFGTLNIYASDPIDLDGLELEDAKEQLRNAMLKHALP